MSDHDFPYQLTHWFENKSDLDFVIAQLERYNYPYKVICRDDGKISIYTQGKFVNRSYHHHYDVEAERDFKKAHGITHTLHVSRNGVEAIK